MMRANETIDDLSLSCTDLDACNAFVSRHTERAVGSGPLEGVRLAVKDNISVGGLPFTAGHPLYASRIACSTASAVDRLRAAGCQVVGVTRTDSGGFGVVTPDVQNPMFPGRIVGGSSGGAAAAVASGLAEIGLGTDTGGSVRIPAACCGLYAFKPTFGRIPIDGVWPLASSLDHVGVIAKNMELLAVAAKVLLDRYQTAISRRPRLGFDLKRLQGCDSATFHEILQTIFVLRSAGFAVFESSLPDVERVCNVHSTIVVAEARVQYAGLTVSERDRLGPAARSALKFGEKLTQADLRSARVQSNLLCDQLESIFDRVDVVIGPTLKMPVPVVGQTSLTVSNRREGILTALVSETCLANLIGAPVVVVPMSHRETPLPISLHMMASPGSDELLLDFARKVSSIVC